LQGDSSKARRVLGWKPEISFESLVKSMVEHDLELAQQELTLTKAGIAWRRAEGRMAEILRPGSRIFVAGHRGLVGSAITRKLQSEGFDNLLLRSRAELDLRDQAAVDRFFATEQPEFVFLAAAKVGGIMANATYPANSCTTPRDPEQPDSRAWKRGVRKLVFLGSSCIYRNLRPSPFAKIRC